MRNGDSWRWNVNKHPLPRHQTISVIESVQSEDRDPDVIVHTVPFGFGVREPAPEVEEWEGNPS